MPRFLVYHFIIFLLGGVVPIYAAPSSELPLIAQKALEQNQVNFSVSDLEFFEKNIRPILSDRCFKCHSAQEGVSKGGLIMDTRAGLLAGGDTGAAIVPNSVEKSLLITAVHQTDPDLSMPPKKGGAKLPDAQIALLEKWVKMGAPAPVGAGAVKLTGLSQKARDHWAFKSFTKPALPKVSNEAWCQNEIDYFILAKLDEQGLKPSAPTDGESLLRRLNYDLIGLPPSNTEVEAFSRDYTNASAVDSYLLQRNKSAHAVSDLVEKTVDRLLASPQYGERWARHWLDSARYADTPGNGIKRGEAYANAWTYRDYVIDAFNQDKPYNQFIVEQLAADRLPDLAKDDPRLAALGFITVGKRFDNNDDTIDERIDTTTKAFLGLTVACARCHDHKFDPIPTADYYSLHGIFASTMEPLDEPMIKTTRIPTATERADFDKKMKDLVESNTRGYYRYIRAQLATLHKDFAGRALSALAGFKSTRSADLQKTYNFTLVREVDTSIIINKISPITAPLAHLQKIPAEEFEEKAPQVIATVLANKKVPINPYVAEALVNLKPKTIDDVALAYQAMFKKYSAQIDKHIDMRSTPGRAGEKDNPDIIQLAAWPWPLPSYEDIDTNPKMLSLITTRSFCYAWQDKPNFLNNKIPGKYFQFEEINKLELTHSGGPGKAMVVADVLSPKNSNVFLRGDRNKKGPVVNRQFLEILSGPNRVPFTQGSGRAELAQAIASPNNPLTARVLVNRVWMQHFGAGIVSSLDDFGNMSEKPTHPELLNWLAAQFVENGWSLKNLHRKMLTSQTYRQSANPAMNPMFASHDDNNPNKIDAGNKYLWRSNLRRLDFESIRDALIMLTGKMDSTVGGRPVNITDEPLSYRRSIYGYIDREHLSDLQAQFDFSDPDMPNSRRNSTIVPQQALFFMNNPLSVEVARAVAARPEVVGAINDDARITTMYRIMFQRTPKSDEARLAKEFIKKVTGVAAESVAAQPTKGEKKKLAKDAPKPIENPAVTTKIEGGVMKNLGVKASRAKVSPWEMLAQAMICSNEFVYLD
ncbi:MAG: PSD1 and planctomycete cytochrome C domain-containing protein [Opitutae bacterium]